MTTLKNLVIYQGGTYQVDLEYLDDDGELKDVVGLSGESQIRKHPGANTSYDFTVTLSEGNIRLEMTSSETANVPKGKHVYDINIIDQSNNVTKEYRGLVRVVPGVTS